MDRALNIAYRLSRWGTWFGGSLVLLAAIIVAVDVVLRKLFVITFGGADELAGYSMAIGSAFAFSFALLERVHVRIDSLYQTLSVRVCAGLDFVGILAFALFMGLVTWHGVGVLSESFAMNTRSMSPLGTPLAIPQTIWICGLVVLLVVMALLVARAGYALVTGDLGTVRRLIGSRSAKEDVADEIQHSQETEA